jgi:hypothetical protein
VQGVSTESVELPDHDRVTLAHVCHQLGQTWAVVACARHGVGERLNDTSGIESCLLLVEGLGDGGDPDVADPMTMVLGALGIGVGVTHKGENNRCETTISETDL